MNPANLSWPIREVKMAKNKQKTWTLFGSHYHTGEGSRRRWPRVLAICLAALIVLYCVCVFSNIPFIKKWRTIYIETAMSTMTHQWLATAFLPDSVVQEVVDQMEAKRTEMIGHNSSDSWGDEQASGEDKTNSDKTGSTSVTVEDTPEQAAFYELFWEIDRETMEDYLEKNPSVLANGWENIYINEAGLDDDGTTIQTTMGEQVLAIDAVNEILLVRVKGSGYRGVLAIAKDPERVTIEASANIGGAGQYAGTIAEQHNGILGMTANGFEDVDGVGNGGQIIGYSMCNGISYGTHSYWGYKRLEIRENNLMYIVDAPTSVTEGTTDAAEFQPALIIDGEIVVDSSAGYTALNPRACLGQSSRYEYLFLVIEGRSLESVGTDVMECADILARHDCMQAMNLDGGTSAILYYDGEYVTRCSNTALPYGRLLPNAVVYQRAETD
jgi:exopolysaccharide biosynthesis protein